MSNKEARQRYRAKLRAEALFHYMTVSSVGLPACEHCGTSDQSVLTLNHVYGGGAADRKARTGGCGGWNFYLKLKQAGWPAGFNVLCANCNMRYSAP